MEQISYHYPPFAGCTVIGGYSRFWMVGATLAQWCFSFTRSTLSSNLHASTAVSEVRPSLWSGMYPQTANILAPTIPESVFMVRCRRRRPPPPPAASLTTHATRRLSR